MIEFAITKEKKMLGSNSANVKEPNIILYYLFDFL